MSSQCFDSTQRKTIQLEPHDEDFNPTLYTDPTDPNFAFETNWDGEPRDFVNVYFYTSYKNGPAYPKLLQVTVTSPLFLYREHSVLLDFCDPGVCDVETLVRTRARREGRSRNGSYWSEGWEWKKVILDENENDFHVFERHSDQFFIYRIADHPGGTNAYCIGLQELADALFYRKVPTDVLIPGLYPDEAPPDLESYILLPFRCICGRMYNSLEPGVWDEPTVEAICPDNRGCKQVALSRMDKKQLPFWKRYYNVD